MSSIWACWESRLSRGWLRLGGLRFIWYLLGRQECTLQGKYAEIEKRVFGELSLIDIFFEDVPN